MVLVDYSGKVLEILST